MEFGSWDPLGFIQTLIKRVKIASSTCNLCGTAPQRYALLCNYCLNDIPKFNYHLCNNDLLNWPAIHKILPKHQFDHLFSLSPHEWPYSHWVGLLKYHGRFDLAPLLGELLFDGWKSVNTYQPEHQQSFVISVPLHIKKWQNRGYNQAHLIAKNFAKHISIHHSVKYIDNAVQRIVNTDSQVGKTGASRRKNLKGAFQLNPTIEWPEHVIIIDDVITTGTTVNELTSLLKKQGVETVTVLTITISLPN